VIRLAAPGWLALAGLTLIFGALWLIRRRWQRFPFPDVERAPRRGAWILGRTTLAGLLVAAALVPLAVSAARPQEVLSRRLERAEGVDLVIALDVSGSMAALDFRPTDRLGVAKEVIGRFVEGRDSDRIGVVVFAGAAVTLIRDQGIILSSTRRYRDRPLRPPVRDRAKGCDMSWEQGPFATLGTPSASLLVIGTRR